MTLGIDGRIWTHCATTYRQRIRWSTHGFYEKEGRSIAASLPL